MTNSKLNPMSVKLSSLNPPFGVSQKKSEMEMLQRVSAFSSSEPKKRAKGKTESLEKLLKHLESFAEYDLINGGFTVIRKRGNHSKNVGEALGTDTHTWKGRPVSTDVRVNYILYKIHHLVWLWHYGEWPTTQLDHINRNPFDNRLENLQKTTNEFNSRNRIKTNANTSGYTGVSWNKNSRKWRAYIMVNYKEKHLGYFYTAEKAHQTREEYIAAHPEFGFTQQHGR